MSKLISAFFLGGVALSAAFAQITITHETLAPIGSSYAEYDPVSPPATLNVGSAGADQTWAIPAMSLSTASQVLVLDPAGTSWENSFPTATHAYRSNLDGAGYSYGYHHIDQTGIHRLGYVNTSTPTPFIVQYDEAGSFRTLPLSYESPAWSEVTEWTLEGQIPIVIKDSLLLKADGWGSMTTQLGTYEVLRLREHHFIITTTMLPPPSPPLVDIYTNWRYYWLTGDGTPVVRMISDNDEPDSNFVSGSISLALPGGESAEPPRGPVASSFSVGQNYPNPFNPTTTLPISLDQPSRVEVTIYNELGEQVSQEEFSFGPGTHTVPFDGSRWASGNYFAQVKAGNQIQTKRMTLMK